MASWLVDDAEICDGEKALRFGYDHRRLTDKRDKGLIAFAGADMNVRFRLLFLPLMVLAAAAGAGCTDTQFIGIGDDDDETRVEGEACTVDAQCDTGRCIGGVCTDGDCTNDEDCREGEICVFGACENADDFACQTDQRPVMTATPTSLTFEQVALGQSAQQVVTVGNIGDCLLTLQVISFSQNTNPDFDCSPCSAEFFPQRIPPGRTLDVTVSYSPTTPGEAAGDLLIRGDDLTAGDNGLFSVSLSADYDGIPALVVSPLDLNFGFIPFTPGGGAGSSTETVTITNQGTGAAALELERLFLDRGEDFVITAVRQGGEPVTVDAIDPENPLLIPPFTVNNPLSTVEVDITFTPDDNRDYRDELVVRPGGIADTQRVVVNLAGSSLGAPQIEVTTQQLVYGNVGDAALLVGTVDFQQVTVRNNGGSDLVIEPRIGGGADAAAEFTVLPAFVPPIPAGSAIILSVFYNPSIPSDPANTFTPARSISAALNITSNDTDPGSDVLKTVALTGWARSGVQDQVLMVEMEFENADNSWAGSDFRNVDLTITNRDNVLTCGKPRFVSVGANDQGVFDDPCDEWNEFGQVGQTSWIGLGAFEEPERVVVRGLGPNGANGQLFDIEVDYIEDCANIPSGILSDVLGITGSVLLGLLGGAIGVPIAVDPGTISDTIANNCFDHASSSVTTRISLNGQVVASPAVRLGAKGDRNRVATLKRINGAFCSMTAGVGSAALQCQ